MKKESYFNFDSKDVYFSEQGTGDALMLLHGNTVSSKLFDKDLDFFSNYFRVIAFDYPGHGKSDRVDKFDENFWHYNALCAIELADMMGIDSLKVIGTSGGALVGLNMAVRKPKLVSKLIADSFFGLELSIDEAEYVVAGRLKGKSNYLMKQYWLNHTGEDWENIVDLDNEMLLNLAQKQINAVLGNLNEITADVLITASRKDKIVLNMEQKMIAIAPTIPNSKLMLFDQGKHTFMITKREKFRPLALDFLKI